MTLTASSLFQSVLDAIKARIMTDQQRGLLAVVELLGILDNKGTSGHSKTKIEMLVRSPKRLSETTVPFISAPSQILDINVNGQKVARDPANALIAEYQVVKNIDTQEAPVRTGGFRPRSPRWRKRM